ncbi:MAG: hypothetical protein ABIN67_07420 [Ferruginibacter sp.]
MMVFIWLTKVVIKDAHRDADERIATQLCRYEKQSLVFKVAF